MRRGSTLMEMVVSIGLLAVVALVSVRLMFMSDRALGAEGERIAAVGGAADLLADLGRDLRQASRVSGGGTGLLVAGAQPIRYQYSRGRGAVVRSAAGREGLVSEYPGLRAHFTPQGRFVTVALTTSTGEVRTGFYLRN